MGKNSLLEKKTAWKKYGLVLESAVIILHQQESIGKKKKKNNKTKKQHQEVLIFKKGMRNTCLSTFTSSKLDFVFLQMTIIAS